MMKANFDYSITQLIQFPFVEFPFFPNVQEFYRSDTNKFMEAVI